MFHLYLCQNYLPLASITKTVYRALLGLLLWVHTYLSVKKMVAFPGYNVTAEHLIVGALMKMVKNDKKPGK
jgi:hypothetical protein